MTLRRGDKGKYVERLQAALRSQGYDIEIDGVFGKHTEQAVREFQRQNALSIDGIAGAQTLAQLFPETAGRGDSVSEIDFSLNRVDIPDEVQLRIDEVVDLIADANRDLLVSLNGALANFDRSMSFPSHVDADPAICNTLLGTAYSAALDKLFGVNLLRVLSRKAFENIENEINQAARARSAVSVLQWIQDQQDAIDRANRSFDPKALREELMLTFLESDDRSRYLDDMFDLRTRLEDKDVAIVPSQPEILLELFEQWIRRHFRGVGDDAPGCIELRFEFDSNEFAFKSCTVQAPFGDKVETGLNRLLEQGQIPRLRRPLDLKVNKRACFFVENMVGGRSWSCGWLNEENQIVHNPILDEAKRALNEIVWRVSAKRFRRI